MIFRSVVEFLIQRLAEFWSLGDRVLQIERSAVLWSFGYSVLQRFGVLETLTCSFRGKWLYRVCDRAICKELVHWMMVGAGWFEKGKIWRVAGPLT